MSMTDLKKIKKAIDNMTLDNLKHIYNIISKKNQPITRKSDCFLINLGNLNKSTIDEIIDFINFIESNTKLLEIDEEMKKRYAEEMKNHHNSSNTNNL
jgi:hypothetical protein